MHLTAISGINENQGSPKSDEDKKGNCRRKWGKDTNSVMMTITSNFLKASISVERNKNDDVQPCDLKCLYDKITDVILKAVRNINKNDIQEIRVLLEQYLNKAKPTSKNKFSSITADTPKWALRGFLETDMANNTISKVGQLLKKMADFVIIEKGQLRKEDVTEFCSNLSKKLNNSELKPITRLQMNTITHHQAAMKYNQTELVTEHSKTAISEPSKDCTTSRVEQLISKSSNTKVNFTNRDTEDKQANFRINELIHDGITSLVFIETLSEQLLMTDWNTKINNGITSNRNYENKEKLLLRINPSKYRPNTQIRKLNDDTRKQITNNSTYQFKASSRSILVHQYQPEIKKELARQTNLSNNKKNEKIPVAKESHFKDFNIYARKDSLLKNGEKCRTFGPQKYETKKKSNLITGCKEQQQHTAKPPVLPKNDVNVKKNEVRKPQMKLKSSLKSVTTVTNMVRPVSAGLIKEKIRDQDSIITDNELKVNIINKSDNNYCESKPDLRQYLRTCKTYSVFSPLQNIKRNPLISSAQIDGNENTEDDVSNYKVQPLCQRKRMNSLANCTIENNTNRKTISTHLQPSYQRYKRNSLSSCINVAERKTNTNPTLQSPYKTNKNGSPEHNIKNDTNKEDNGIKRQYSDVNFKFIQQNRNNTNSKTSVDYKITSRIPRLLQ